MCHVKGVILFSIEQHQCVTLLVESKLFVQHSIDVEGEHGHTRWMSHRAFFTVGTEEKYKFANTGSNKEN